MTGGMKVKAEQDESSPYAAMLAAQDVVQRCKELGVIALCVKFQATGGNRTKPPGPSAQSALRALLAVVRRLGGLKMSPPSLSTAPTGREVAVCE